MTDAVMKKADKALASAKLLLAAHDSDGATNRAYYAMFDATIAALMWVGGSAEWIQPKTHTGLIARLGLQLVQAGHLSVEFGRSLNRIEDLRLTADYLAEPVPHEKAERAVKEAEAFAEAIRALLSKL
jgi:uncharacterized protein (UPF0332 family)